MVASFGTMTDLGRLTAALAGRYTIGRELGAGGMATVYLAEDLKHHRKVAVKVLRPHLAAILGSDRFLREIEIAARLQHPHIVPLFDSGQAEGFVYYVMPFVEGESLRDRLTRERELPIPQAAGILRDVADALTHAHDHGVMHRDIKPDNIMLSGRHAMVADFGVARAVGEATGAEQLTTAGVALGTPSYMAPEQATAEPNVDHRADIYAVGALAYEVLTGRPPFTGDTQAVLSAHVTRPPDPVTTHRESVPPALADLVMRCLAKDPADRWDRAAELVPQLEHVAAGSGTSTETTSDAFTRSRAGRWTVGAAAVLAMLVAGTFLPFPSRAPTLDPSRIVVAPFENQTGVDSLDVFGGFLADYLANQIARTALGQVVPAVAVREVTMTEDLTGHGPQRLARATDAGVVISGTYVIESDTLAILAQITDANALRLLNVVGPFGDAASAPMRAAAAFGQRLLGSLALVMDPDGPPAAIFGQPPSFEAYRHYDAAWHLWFLDEYPEALRLLYRALSADSTFGAALLLAAATEWNNTGDVAKTDSLLQVAERYREQLAPVEVARLDWLQAYVLGDIDAALRAGRRSMALFETLALLRDALRANRPREAVEFATSVYDRYLTRSGSIWAWGDLTTSHHLLHDHETELREAKSARRLNPDTGLPLDYEMRAFAALGQVDAARGRFDDVLAMRSDPGKRGVERLWHPGGSFRDAALALRAHGARSAASEALELSLQWFANLAAPDADAFRYSRAQTLYASERWADAKALIDSLRLEYPDSIGALGYAGTIAARMGDREEALRISAALEAVETPYVFGNTTRWRARIAALLGDAQMAVDLLYQAYQEGGSPVQLLHDMDVESLRGFEPFDRFIEPKG